MSDPMPIEGTFEHPFQFDPFQRIIEVQWGNYAILEINYPEDVSYDFFAADGEALKPTKTPLQYDPLQVIAKKGAPDNFQPIIEVQLTERNPVTHFAPERTGFTFVDLFAESVMFLWPPVTVIDDGIFQAEDQARWDSFIAGTNAATRAGYDFALTFQPGVISDFMRLHPEAMITRGETDLRLFLDTPPGGWGDKTFTYLPQPWFSVGGSNSPSNPAGRTTVSHPAYEAWTQPIGSDLFEPILSGFCLAKYPNYASQDRNRDNFMIDLSRLTSFANATPAKTPISIKLSNARTNHINSAFEFNWFAHGGTFTSAKLRKVTYSSPPEEVVKTTRLADAKSPIDTVLVKFDQHGFIPLPRP